jgi:hypothetical protein
MEYQTIDTMDKPPSFWFSIDKKSHCRQNAKQRKPLQVVVFGTCELAVDVLEIIYE